MLIPGDNFMFCKVMENYPELCKEFLETILQKKIKSVHIQETEKVIDITSDGRSIRLDVYLDDDEGTVYDLEMQTTNQLYLP